MNEKKFPHDTALRREDAALEDDAVETVTGGEKRTSHDMAEDAWEKVKQQFSENKNKEEQP